MTKEPTSQIGSRNAAPRLMETDFVLLQQLQELGNGQTIHKQANLSAAYQTAVREYKRTGDEDFRAIATEAHRELRKLLTTIRDAAFSSAWSRFSAC